VPGNPLDPRAAGTNGLIADGATIATCSEDIIDALKPMLSQPLEMRTDNAPTFDSANDKPIKMDVAQPDRERVIEALGFSPVDIDELIRATGLEARHVQIILLELDLAGRLERHGGQLVSLRDV